jgi:hypothetical protein
VSVGARVSVNMKPATLARFLDGEPRRNIFEVAAEESARTEQTLEEVLRGRLKEWYARRVEFEARAGAGRHFHYGALNVGGMGAPRYGRLCVIDKRPIGTDAPDPVWIAQDSLRGPWFEKAGQPLDWDALRSAVAPCELVSDLVVVKLETLGPSSAALDARICNDEDYLEALSLSPLEVQHVEEIRSESEDDLQERARRALLRDARLDEQLDLALQDRIRTKAAARGIPWRSIPA